MQLKCVQGQATSPKLRASVSVDHAAKP